MNAGAMLVAVDGIDGSGKSRFADALAHACAAEGLRTTVVRVDDFRRPGELEGVGPEREAEVYYQRYYDFDAVDARLDALFAAPEAPAAVVILEGVFVLRARRAAGARLIVLEVAEDVALERLRARDIARGRAPAEVERRIRERYLPGQARYRAAFDPVGRADLVIDNTDWTRPSLVRRGPGQWPQAMERGLRRIL